MNNLRLLCLIVIAFTIPTLFPAVLKIENRSNKVITVDNRNSQLNESKMPQLEKMVEAAKGKKVPATQFLGLYDIIDRMPLKPGQTDQFNTWFHGIDLLTFSENGTIVAAVNPHIIWSDIQSKVVYHSPEMIEIHNEASQALRKAETAFEILGGAVALPAEAAILVKLKREGRI